MFLNNIKRELLYLKSQKPRSKNYIKRDYIDRLNEIHNILKYIVSKRILSEGIYIICDLGDKLGVTQNRNMVNVTL